MVLHFQLVIPFLLAFLASQVAQFESPVVPAEDWPAFRGGELAAVASERHAPTRWSVLDGRNIRWRTNLVGRGNSSPVIRDGQLFVTTAYSSPANESLSQMVSWLSLGLMVPVGLAVFGPWSRHRRKSIDGPIFRRQTVEGGLLFFGLMSLTFLLIFAESLFDYVRCPIRQWLGTSLVATLCLAVLSFGVDRRSGWNVLVGLSLLLVAAAVLLGIPSRDHAFRDGIFATNALVVWWFASIPAVLGVLCLGNVFTERLVRGRKSTVSEKRFPPFFVGFILLTILLAVASTLAGIRITQSPVEGEKPPHGMALLGWLMGTLLVVVMLWIWGYRENPDSNDENWIGFKSRWFDFLAKLAVALLPLGIGIGSSLITVNGSPFLAYHLSNLHCIPTLGWISVVLVMVSMIAAAYWACRQTTLSGETTSSEKSSRQVGRLGIACAALIGGLQFAKTPMVLGPPVLTRAIVCLDTGTGRTLWTCEGLRGPEGVLHRSNSPATPTAVVTDDGVLAYFGAAGAMCSNLQGKLRWERRDLPFQSAYGIGASPAGAGSVAVIVGGGPNAPYLAALNTKTGTEKWRIPLERDPERISGLNRTPLILSLRDRCQCALVWEITALNFYDILSGEKRISVPLPEATGDMVASLATDGHFIYGSGPGESWAIDLSQVETAATFRWKKRITGSNCASPVCADGLLFTVTDNGVINCVDASHGTPFWKCRVSGQYFSSPLVVGNKLYATNTEGKTAVLDVDKKENRIAENDVGSPLYATFAASNGCLFARTDSEVICIGETKPLRGQK